MQASSSSYRPLLLLLPPKFEWFLFFMWMSNCPFVCPTMHNLLYLIWWPQVSWILAILGHMTKIITYVAFDMTKKWRKSFESCDPPFTPHCM